jgi:hypothetical protein
MAILGQHKSNINQSDDSSDYEVGFHRDALFLIIAGHKRLTENAADYSNEEEPNITGELVSDVLMNISKPQTPVNGPTDMLCMMTHRRMMQYVWANAGRKWTSLWNALKKEGIRV